MKLDLDGQLLKEMIKYAYNSLLINKNIINDLNVFPIPDGDTGENMCLTLEGGLSAIKDKDTNNLSEMARFCSDGMTNSARGNSGVILSQLFFGFAEGLRDLSTVGIWDILSAIENGVKFGYLAVDKPTEGTMLTVVREVAEELSKLDLHNIEIDDFMKRLLDIAKKSVDSTPEKLNKLKENGVVDAGGAGIYYIIEGCYKYLCGIELDENLTNQTQNIKINYNKFNENSVLEFGYCSEVMLQLTRAKTDIDKFNLQLFKQFLNTIGESIVVFQNGYIIKVHIHTFEPYKLLEFCARFGEFLTVKIENMMLQHNEAHIQNNFAPRILEKKERRKYGVVAVANGSGVIKAFRDFGADIVINGGKFNSPSSKDFANAFDEINCDVIFVLVNNCNAFLPAKQIAKNYKLSKIYVIETKNIGEGYAVLSMLDFSSNNEEKIVEKMYEEIRSANIGAITIATRATNSNNISINKNDYIGLINDKIVTSTHIKIRAIYDLLDKMSLNSKDYVVLIYGESFTEKEKRLMKEYITSKRNDLEVYEIDGNQGVYDVYVITN